MCRRLAGYGGLTAFLPCRTGPLPLGRGYACHWGHKPAGLRRLGWLLYRSGGRGSCRAGLAAGVLDRVLGPLRMHFLPAGRTSFRLRCAAALTGASPCARRTLSRRCRRCTGSARSGGTLANGLFFRLVAGRAGRRKGCSCRARRNACRTAWGGPLFYRAALQSGGMSSSCRAGLRTAGSPANLRGLPALHTAGTGAACLRRRTLRSGGSGCSCCARMSRLLAAACSRLDLPAGKSSSADSPVPCGRWRCCSCRAGLAAPGTASRCTIRTGGTIAAPCSAAKTTASSRAKTAAAGIAKCPATSTAEAPAAREISPRYAGRTGVLCCIAGSGARTLTCVGAASRTGRSWDTAWSPPHTGGY